MGQPNPPGDIPLVEGLDASWNDFVSAFPEEQRAELGSKFKERVSEFDKYKQWDDLTKSGITSDQASYALNLASAIESDPKAVYETLGAHLGITPQEAKQAIKEIKQEQPAADSGNDDTELAKLRHTVETLSQIQLAQRQQTVQEQLAEQQDAQIQSDLEGLAKKYGDVNEKQILMRMLHLDMSPEEAYQDFMSDANEIRKTRPAPYIMGANGGTIPARQIDPTKLGNKDVKDVVAQMLEQGNIENRL
jgi:hypothetical protein